MIGPRVGVAVGVNVGVAVGASSDPIAGAGIDFLLLIFGQSAQGYGFVTDGFAGTGSTAFAPKGRSGSDPGLLYNTPLPACRFSQDSADGPANPQTYPIHTGIEDLQRYSASSPNCGIAEGIGRWLVSRGVARNPAIVVCAIGATSVPLHWAPGAFPASGEKLYTHLKLFGQAAMASFGRPIDLLWWGIGDTDAGTPAQVTSMPTDTASLLSSLRTDWALPSLPVFMGMIHPDLQAPADTAGFRAKQIAFQPTDIDTTLVDCKPSGTPAPIDLENNPHFLQGGINDYGDLVALRIAERFRPGANLNLGTGPAPWYQGGAAGYSSQASPLTARPLGYVQPAAGDIEILVTHSSLLGDAVTLTTAASFSSLIALTDSTSGGQHRGVAVWSRTVDSTLLGARVAQPDGVKRGSCARPEIDFATNTINWATIHCVRGASGIDTTSTGANNANGTTLSIGGFTTSVNNCLVLFTIHGNTSLALISSVVNSKLTNIKQVRSSHQVNAGTGSLNTNLWSAIAPLADVYGATTVTFATANLAVGAAIVFKP